MTVDRLVAFTPAHARSAVRPRIAGSLTPQECRALDITGSEAEALGENRAALKLVRRDVSQPLFQIGGGESNCASGGLDRAMPNAAAMANAQTARRRVIFPPQTLNYIALAMMNDFR